MTIGFSFRTNEAGGTGGTRRAAARTLGLVALGVTFGAGAAHGQAIDQYLNPDIPGYGTGAGITVASRTHPEYDPIGIRYGAYTINPSLTESLGYESNVTGTSNAHGSPTLETNAAIGAVADYTDTNIAGSVDVDDNEFFSQSSQSYTNWSAALGGSHNFGPDTFYIGATHLNLTQTPRDLDVPALDSSIAYRVEDGRISYRAEFGHSYLMPAIDLSSYSFDNGMAGGIPYIQSYRDRFVYAPSLEGGYEFDPRRRIVVVLRDTQANFSHAIAGVPRENFNDWEALAGLAYDVNGIIGFRLLAGFEERNFEFSKTYRQISAPIVEGAVTWTPTSLTTVKGTVARYIEDSASEATTGFTETAVKLSVDHELYRNVILSGSGSVFLDNYVGGGNQIYYTASAGATWHINRNLQLTGTYTFAARDASSSVPAQFSPTDLIFGGNYTDNIVLISVKIGL